MVVARCWVLRDRAPVHCWVWDVSPRVPGGVWVSGFLEVAGAIVFFAVLVGLVVVGLVVG